MELLSNLAEGDGFAHHVRRPANRPDSTYAFPPPTPIAAGGSYGERRHSRSYTTPAALRLAAASPAQQQTWSLQPYPLTAREPSFAAVPHFYSAPRHVQPTVPQSPANAASFLEANYPRRGARPRRSVSHNPPTFLSFPTLTAAAIPRDVASQPIYDSAVEQYTPFAPHLPVDLPPPALSGPSSRTSGPEIFPLEDLPRSFDSMETEQALVHAGHAPVDVRLSGRAFTPPELGLESAQGAMGAVCEPSSMLPSESEQPGRPSTSTIGSNASARNTSDPATQGKERLSDEGSGDSAEPPVQPSTLMPTSSRRAQIRSTNIPLIVESVVSEKAASPGRKRSRRARMAGVFHPPPQSMLRPGVVIPSAGAIAAPLGRGKAIFPGTSSSSRPSAEDFAKMPLQKRKVRGRKALVLADLGLTLDDVNDPYTPATDAQIAFAGVKRSGEPRKLHYCKVPGCEQVFKRTEHLKRHVRSIHTVERPFQCQWPTCKQYFGRHDNLYQHLRVHRTPNETHAEFSAKLEAYFGARLDEVKLEQAQFLDDLREAERQLGVEPLSPSSATEVGDGAQDENRSGSEVASPPRRHSFRLPNPPTARRYLPETMIETAPPAPDAAGPTHPADGMRDTAPPRRQSSRRNVSPSKVVRADSEECAYESSEPVAQAWRAATGLPMYPESLADASVAA